MNELLLGAKFLPSPIIQAVVPGVALPAPSTQRNDVPPHGWTSMPRCFLYQSRNAAGCFALMKTPPIPVTLFKTPALALVPESWPGGVAGVWAQTTAGRKPKTKAPTSSMLFMEDLRKKFGKPRRDAQCLNRRTHHQAA